MNDEGEYKALERDEFREKVFLRDGHKCVSCGCAGADAHHIIERRLWPDGGYHLDNGVTLCPDCHIKAEQTLIGCEDLRFWAGIKNVCLPPDFHRDEKYDKWGNVYLPNGLRVRGELFFDASVQLILASGNVLDQFTKYVKFPKICHFPWSDGIIRKYSAVAGKLGGDRVFSNEDVKTFFEGQEVVVTEKVDGENTTMYRDYVHARSLDSRNHVSRNWMRNRHASMSYNIPEDWRISGENVFAKHSISYENLPSYFLVFCIYDERNMCLSWDETVDWCKLLDLEAAPVLWRGIYNEKTVRSLFTGQSVFTGSQQEGYVVRLAASIPWSKHKQSFAKYVRKSHVTTSHNWMNEVVIKNKLKGHTI